MIYGHIFKIYSSENKKAVWLTCEEKLKVSQVNCTIGIGLGISVCSQYSIGIGCKNLVSVHHYDTLILAILARALLNTKFNMC